MKDAGGTPSKAPASSPGAAPMNSSPTQRGCMSAVCGLMSGGISAQLAHTHTQLCIKVELRFALLEAAEALC